MTKLRDLLQHSVTTEIVPGVWVAARPLDGPWIHRVRDAWAVFLGRADAFTWPTKDDPRSWCAVDTRSRDMVIEIDQDGHVSRPVIGPIRDGGPLHVKPQAICERCQMHLPERLVTFGIGVRGGTAARCAACSPQPGADGEAKRQEVIALRRKHFEAAAVRDPEGQAAVPDQEGEGRP